MIIKIAVLISGRGSNMESLLNKSHENKLDIEFIVISDNPNAEGLLIAERMGVRAIVLKESIKGCKLNEENANEIERIIEENNIYLMLLAGFMRIIPNKLIKKYPMKFINIHPSLLPSFKGKEAQKDAFDYGVKVSGCTVHFIDEGIDTGPIIMQRSVDISSASNAEEVKTLILKAEHNLYFEAMRGLLEKNYHIEGRRVIFGG